VNAIKGTVKSGKIVADVPPNWPDGCEVLIEPVVAAKSGAEENGLAPTPEEIAECLARMDRIEPLVMTPEEEAEWAAARKAQKVQDKANFEARAERLRSMWE
jgi:hypothetical protein